MKLSVKTGRHILRTVRLSVIILITITVLCGMSPEEDSVSDDISAEPVPEMLPGESVPETLSGESVPGIVSGENVPEDVPQNTEIVRFSSTRTPFPDVPADHWAAAEIKLCVECGFFSTMEDGTFGLGHSLGRGAFLSILSRFFDWPAVSSLSVPYSDVSPENPYAVVIAQAYTCGVVTEQNTLFRPDDPITREELAVMLIRALGYRAISGLTDPYPFADVTTNSGYITMAHDLGLVNGNHGAFMPDQTATREQTAAILARLWRKLYATVPARIGIVSSLQGTWVRAGLETGAIFGGTLTAGTRSVFTWAIDRDSAGNIRDEIRRKGMTALLYVKGDTLYGNAPDVLAEAVRSYDGLMLELSGAETDTEQLRRLKNTMGGGQLMLIVPVPGENSTYPYETVAETADLLIVRVESGARFVDGFPVDPVDPLENVYDALRTLKRRVGEKKLAFMLTTSSRLWSSGQTSEILSGQDVETLLRLRTPSLYYSERYACAYFRIPAADRQVEQVCWYLDKRSASARIHLAQLFDLGGIALSDADGVSVSVREALTGG